MNKYKITLDEGEDTSRVVYVKNYSLLNDCLILAYSADEKEYIPIRHIYSMKVVTIKNAEVH